MAAGRARVAQLDRASASGAEGRGFESRLAHLPQSSERSICSKVRPIPWSIESDLIVHVASPTSHVRQLILDGYR
jgi:hypothetical protein